MVHPYMYLLHLIMAYPVLIIHHFLKTRKQVANCSHLIAYMNVAPIRHLVVACAVDTDTRSLHHVYVVLRVLLCARLSNEHIDAAATASIWLRWGM